MRNFPSPNSRPVRLGRSSRQPIDYFAGQKLRALHFGPVSIWNRSKCAPAKARINGESAWRGSPQCASAHLRKGKRVRSVKACWRQLVPQLTLGSTALLT